MGHAYGHDIHRPDGSFSSLVSGPAVPLLSLPEAKDHLRVDGTDEDTLIAAYVEAVNDMLDASYGELGRALITQRWQLTLAEFPSSGRIDLPIPPVQAVTSITYYDTDNVQQTLSTDTYRLTVGPDGAVIDQVDGEEWPTVFDRADAVAIQYDTGYGNAAADVPEGIRMAARLMLTHFYEQRSAVADRAMVEVPLAVKSLLMKFRIVRGHI